MKILAKAHQSAIVTRTNLYPSIESKFAGYRFNDRIFADLFQFHLCSNRTRIRLSALNKACMVIGTNRLPLSSYARANTEANTKRGKKLGRFRWIKANSKLTCSCGTLIEIEADQFRAEIAKVERSMNEDRKSVV